MAQKRIRTRREGACSFCDAGLERGTHAYWDASTRELQCLECAESSSAANVQAGEEPTEEIGQTPSTAPVSEADAAGASAQREYERRRDAREQRVRERFPRIGGLLLAISDEPQSTKAWAKGASGERRVGEHLDALRDDGCVVFHDRLIQRSKANIDHVVVAPSGVWVIDAKHYSGRIERRDVGGWLSTDERLFVNGRDRTKLVGGMEKQVKAVERAIAPTSVDSPIHAVLCFTMGEWGWFASTFRLENVLVAWPKATVEAVRDRDGLEPEQMLELAAALNEALRPA